MKKAYLTPQLEAVTIASESVFLYSGLRDMQNEDIYLEEELEDDDL